MTLLELGDGCLQLLYLRFVFADRAALGFDRLRNSIGLSLGFSLVPLPLRFLRGCRTAFDGAPRGLQIAGGRDREGPGQKVVGLFLAGALLRFEVFQSGVGWGQLARELLLSDFLSLLVELLTLLLPLGDRKIFQDGDELADVEGLVSDILGASFD